MKNNFTYKNSSTGEPELPHYLSANNHINLILDGNFVYLLHFKDYPGMFKIGKSINAENRMQTLQAQWGKIDFKKSLKISIPKGKESAIEKLLHAIFSDHHINDLPKKDGYTEFFSIKCFESVIEHINTINNLNKIPLLTSSLKKEKKLENIKKKPKKRKSTKEAMLNYEQKNAEAISQFIKAFNSVPSELIQFTQDGNEKKIIIGDGTTPLSVKSDDFFLNLGIPNAWMNISTTAIVRKSEQVTQISFSIPQGQIVETFNISKSFQKLMIFLQSKESELLSKNLD